jgi:hypothetical protein
VQFAQYPDGHLWVAIFYACALASRASRMPLTPSRTARQSDPSDIALSYLMAAKPM